MKRAEIDAALALAAEASPGPWEAVQLTHNGELLRGDDLVEYIRNSIKASPREEFLAVLCEKPDGPADVCHVGNGPTSPANARFIEKARELVPALVLECLRWRRRWAEDRELHAVEEQTGYSCSCTQCSEARAILAEPEVKP